MPGLPTELNGAPYLHILNSDSASDIFLNYMLYYGIMVFSLE